MSNTVDGGAVVAELLARAGNLKPLTVEIYGTEITFNYKPLLWIAKNRCLSAATTFATDEHGNVRLSVGLDKYFTLALQEMIVSPPFPLTDKVIESFPEDVGAIFQSIVPSPFETGVGKATAMGKDSETSSTEEDPQV